MITIKQIANEAGVSKSTVSRYLNNGYVSQASAEKIQKIIDKYNFSPNEFARNLKAEKSKFIGVIIPRLDSLSVMAMLEGIDQRAREAGYQILISNTNLEKESEIESLNNLVQNKVAGIILIATEISQEHIDTVQKIPVPVIFVGQSNEAVYSVNHDNYLAGKNLAAAVLPSRPKNVIYIGVSEKDVSVGIERKNGVLDTLGEAGVPVKTIYSSFRSEDTYLLGLELLKKSSETLYIAATDNMALGLIKAAHELNISVGEMISITGFGGYGFGEYLFPSLTTVDFHYKEVGETAADRLYQKIQGQEIPQQTIVETSVLIRNSLIKKND
ncbi:LacI family DNA-binding transcriptional regulator [Enterococcus mediterraneensis]|uniref:LacI family DNA-binding transcriptional regulator n=1 Tax=Enterococcus mediterraneensis TaxID=2364791 RepID=UPI000F04D81C|nr:LacI family DNA-binding transcriptional regulator [Enterococcus mediterraneensis]